MPDPKLSKLLDSRHGSYDYDEFMRHWHFYCGGKSLIDRKYIRAHKKEDPNIFADRVSRGYYINFIKPIINLVTDFIFQMDQVRRDPKPDWLSDVDQNGTPVDEFMANLATRGIVQGLAFAVADHDPVDPSETPTRADERAQGKLPYWYIVAREDMLNWSLDEKGRPLWALYRSSAPPIEDPLSVSERGKYEYYILWQRDAWAKIRENVDKTATGKVEVVDEGPNELGEVPIVPFYGDKMDEWEGISWNNDVTGIAQNLLNICSLRDNYNYETAVEQPVFPGMDSDTARDLFRGPRYVLTHPMEYPTAYYLAPSGIAANILKEQIKDHIDTIHRLMRQRIINASANADGASGVSKQEDFRSTSTALTALANECERVENVLHRLSDMYQGGSGDTATTVHAEYPNDFDLEAVDRAIERYQNIDTLDVPDSFRSWQLKKIIDMLATASDDSKEINDIKDDIDEMFKEREQQAEAKSAEVEGRLFPFMAGSDDTTSTGTVNPGEQLTRSTA